MYKEYKKEELEALKKAELLIVKDFEEVCSKYNLRWFAIGGTVIGAVRHQGFIPWDDDIDLGMLREDYEKFLEVWELELGDKYELATPNTDRAYSSPVVKLMRKGTRFVPEYLVHSKASLGMHIDIFIYDNYTDDERSAKQIKNARIWDQLLFLRGSGSPVIPLKGFKKMLAAIACKIIHGLLVLFRISPKWLYKKLNIVSKKYNSEETEYVTTYQDPRIHASRIAYKEVNPVCYLSFENTMMPVPNDYMTVLKRYYGEDVMELPPVEKRVNHAPAILDFGPYKEEIDGLE